MDACTGVLQAPLTVMVGGHTKPSEVFFHAIVTGSDLKFSEHFIDFGHCTVCETIVKAIQVLKPCITQKVFI